MDHERLSNGEITKDAVQDTVVAAATAVGTVATVVTGAVRDVARAVGTFGTEVFEIRESVRRARRDADE
jgi:regulator of RNase E activity RraA